jgi:DHA1 family multidrug resistance protein-like MFS transporter
MIDESSKLARRMFMLCILGALAIFSTTMAKSPVLPYFARALGASDYEVGLIGATSPATGILISAPIGVLMDRNGPRKLLWGASILFAFVPFLYFWVSTPLQLVAVRFVHGAATAILGPVALAVVAGWYGERRGERMALYSSSTRVGRTLAPLMGGFLFAIPVFEPYGIDVYRGIYLVCGLFGMSVLALSMLLPLKAGPEEKESTVTSQSSIRRPTREVFTRDVLLICAAQAATFFLYGAYELFMPLYWNEVVGIPEWVAGPMFTLLTATILVSGPIIGRISDRRSRLPFIVTGLVSLCILVALTSIVSYFIIQVVLVVPIGISIAATDSTTSPLVTEMVDPSLKGSVLGLLSTIMDVGHSSGQFVLGLFLALGNNSYSFAFIMTSAMLFTIPVLVFLGIRGRSSATSQVVQPVSEE